MRLIPSQYVKPYVKRSKNDAAYGEATCEAATQPNMRFAPTKTRETRVLPLLHSARSQLVSQRTAMINCVRSGLAEFGIVFSSGVASAALLLNRVAADNKRIPQTRTGSFAGYRRSDSLV